MISKYFKKMSNNFEKEPDRLVFDLGYKDLLKHAMIRALYFGDTEVSINYRRILSFPCVMNLTKKVNQSRLILMMMDDGFNDVIIDDQEETISFKWDVSDAIVLDDVSNKLDKLSNEINKFMMQYMVEQL